MCQQSQLLLQTVVPNVEPTRLATGHIWCIIHGVPVKQRFTNLRSVRRKCPRFLALSQSCRQLLTSTLPSIFFTIRRTVSGGDAGGVPAEWSATFLRCLPQTYFFIPCGARYKFNFFLPYGFPSKIVPLPRRFAGNFVTTMLCLEKKLIRGWKLYLITFKNFKSANDVVGIAYCPLWGTRRLRKGVKKYAARRYTLNILLRATHVTLMGKKMRCYQRVHFTACPEWPG